MKCVVLAAGYATRLYPLTQNYPKPLLMVGEKSILDRLIDDLAMDIEEFVIVSNHKYYNIFEEWRENKIIKCPLSKITIIDDGTSTNETRLGAVKDIQLAIKEKNITDDVLVVAGDNVLDFSLHDFIKYAENHKTSCVMCYEENDLVKQQKTAIITVDENNIITSYEEKPKKPRGNLAVPPFYFFCKRDLTKLEEALHGGCGYDAPGSFAAWLSEKTIMYAYAMIGKRYDIGDINSYELTKKVFSN